MSNNHQSIESLIERGFVQANGMNKFPDDSKSAPFKSDDIKTQTQALQEKKTQQEILKGELQRLTQEVTQLGETLETDIARNVSYFAGVWGKHDKRLIEIGGHPLPEHAHHHAKSTAEA